MAGRNIKINQIANGMPQVDKTLSGWTISFIVDYPYQVRIDGEFINRSRLQRIEGVLQPLQLEQLELKPEGQRAWKWYQLHVDKKYKQLPMNGTIEINKAKYKVMASKDYSLNGYIEYHLVQDYRGS